MNGCKKLFKIFVLCVCMVSVMLCCVNASAETESHFKTGNIKQEADGGYVLYDNYAKFDGTVYEYDLNELFPDSELTAYTFTITSDYPETGNVIIDDNVLRIVPHEQMTDTIMITAADLAGETVEISFRLNFVDSFRFVINKTTVFLIIALIVLLIVLGVLFLTPIYANVKYTDIARNNSESVIYGIKIFPKTHSKCEVKGRLLGANGKFIIFIPSGVAYTKEQNRFKKVMFAKIKPREELVLYKNTGGQGKTKIKFVEVYNPGRH